MMLAVNLGATSNTVTGRSGKPKKLLNSRPTTMATSAPGTSVLANTRSAFRPKTVIAKLVSPFGRMVLAPGVVSFLFIHVAPARITSP